MLILVCVCRQYVPVMALLISVAAASRISNEACSLYQAVWGVQIRLGASFSGPWVKLEEQSKRKRGEVLDKDRILSQLNRANKVCCI